MSADRTAKRRKKDRKKVHAANLARKKKERKDRREKNAELRRQEKE